MNYNLNSEWLFSKQFKAATVTFLLAASMLLFAGVGMAPQAAAANTGTLTLSQGQMFGNMTVQITVNDPDLNVAAVKDTYNIGPQITWTNTSGVYYINSTQALGGSWNAYATDALYVAQTCSISNVMYRANLTASDKSNNASHARYHPGHAAAGSGANGLTQGSCARSHIENFHLDQGVPSTRTYANHTYGGGTATGLSADHSIANDPVIHMFNITRGHTITITYKDASDSTGTSKDVSATLLYKETKPVLDNNGKTEITPQELLNLRVTHMDRNNDPTKKDHFSVSNNSESLRLSISSSSNTTLANLVNKTLLYSCTIQGITRSTGKGCQSDGSSNWIMNFTETGINTGIFDLSVGSDKFNMSNLHVNDSSHASVTTSAAALKTNKMVRDGSTLKSLWSDGDKFKISMKTYPNTGNEYNATSCTTARGSSSNSNGHCTNATSVTFTIKETSSTLTSSATTLSFSDDVTFTMEDFDQNSDATVKDTIATVYAEINDSSPITVTAKESAVNSSSFTFTVRATIGTYTSGCSFSTTYSRLTCTIDPSQAKNTVIDVTYTDQHTAAVRSLSLTFVTTAATVTTSVTSIDESATSFKITYEDPDSNDASATAEQLLFNATNTVGTCVCMDGDSDIPGIYHGTVVNRKKVANFTITKINGTNGYHDLTNASGLITETDKDTGIWELTVTLASLRTSLDVRGGTGPLGLTAGDKLVVSVKDQFDATTTNITITIGGTVGTLAWDRTDFPITVDHASTGIARNQSRVNATITLTDSDKNTNANAKDNATLRLRVLNGTGKVVGNTRGGSTISIASAALGYLSWYNVTAQETGVDTGVFTFKMGINWGNANADIPTIMNYSKPTQSYYALDTMKDMIGGSICAEWQDGAATSNITTAHSGAGVITGNAAKKGVSSCIDIKAHDATISANITTGKLGDVLEITATEPDYNRDVGVKDKLYMLVIGTNKQDKPSETDTAQYNLTVALTETGVNTGIFAKNITLEPGKSPFASTLAANSYLRFRIRDNATSNSFYSGAGLARASATHAVTVTSTTTTLSLTPGDASGPDGKVYIKLTDPDLMTTAASSMQMTKIVSNGTDDVEKPYASNGTTSTGTYWFAVTLARSTGSPTNEDGTLHVNGTDIVYFYYTDTKDADGVIQVISATLNIKTEAGAVSLDKVNYLVAEFATITVTDLDANTSPDTKQSITVKASTESWEVGTTITLQETGADTDVFTGQVELIATTKGVPSGAQVSAAVGDTLTIKYTDTLCDDSKKCYIYATAKVGQALSKTEQVPAGDPEVVDTSGNLITSPNVGDILIIQASITNDDDVAHTVTFLVQIKNANGEIVNLGWVRDIELAVDESQTPGMSWLPDSAGTYTAEVYVWDSLTSAVALSPVKSTSFTVG